MQPRNRFENLVQLRGADSRDVLCGDYLAELTMLILAKAQAKDPSGGYARTFLTQMEQVLGTCLDRGIKVVANAGGLNPAGLAAALRELSARLGLTARVAHVEGDDLRGDLHAITPPVGDIKPVSANAYLGAWGITEALHSGADVVVTGRVTDASLVVGPAAWWHGWERTDWDRLAGAVVAGHVIECGPQATGGNYAFLDEITDRRYPGFPIAEVAADGSSVITKHPGGGAVSVDTVTAQLLYEIAGARYANPDVVCRFDTIRLLVSPGGSSDGVGFAVPANIVRRVFDQLRQGGRVRRGEIGVHVQTVTPALARGLGLRRERGVIVSDLLPRGGAARAGVQLGDLVLSLDGKPIENARQLTVNLYLSPPGASVRLELLRGEPGSTALILLPAALRTFDLVVVQAVSESAMAQAEEDNR